MLRQVLLACSLFVLCVAVEYENHGANEHAHPIETDGSDSYGYDNEVFLGSRKVANEFMGLSVDEAKDRLLVSLAPIDTDKDSFLSKEELTAHLKKNFLKLDEEAAAERLQHVDTNKDGFADFAEIVMSTYNTDIDTLEGLVNNETALSDPAVKGAVKTYLVDKAKFELADANKDGKLGLEEYTAYTHPYDFVHMLPVEVKQTMETYDIDNDGRISLQEFLHDESTNGDEEWRKQEAERFTNELDKNQDGFLDAEEVSKWVAPSMDASANDEADHLLRLLDTDHDGKLSQAELIAGVNVLVGHAEEEDEPRDEL